MTAPQPSVRKRTAAQLTAGSPEASVWVSANAGTGKTGVLVDRISRLLLGGVRPERILCLTFTKAAAAEMSNRLTALLNTWSAMPDDALEAELQALGTIDIDDEMMTRARQLFARTLDAPEGLRIRTIHSFCEGLLGRFPLEARISPDFKVMDERGQRELQREARDRVLSEAEDTGSPVMRALYDLAGLVDESRFADLIHELDSSRTEFLSALERLGGSENLIDAVHQTLGLAPGETQQSVLLDACTIEPAEAENLERIAAAWANGSKTHKEGAEIVLAWLALDPHDRAPRWRQDIADRFLTAKGELRAESGLMSKGAAAADPGALALALHAGTVCITVLDRLRAVNTALASAALIRVGAALIGAYETIKKTRGKLDYDDLIEHASGLLNSPGGVSWVHYKLDGGLEHVLVDEAQDTSPQQWRVIEEITSDFFAGEGAYEETSDAPRTIFAVGDEKQSIYSFQGAEPAMFGGMRDRFANRATEAGRTWRPVDMAESFRSSKAVLDVVDHVFQVPEFADGLSFGDKPVRHLSARHGQSGQVTLWPTEEPLQDDGDDEPWDVPVDHVSIEQSPEGRVATRIANTIRSWLDEGEILPAQGRAVRPGDILILVQKRRRFAGLMVAALKQRGIAVSGRDRMVLTEQLVIQDLIALGRMALLPEDDLTLATVLKGPLVGLTEDELYDLAKPRSGSLLTALQGHAGDGSVYDEVWRKVSEWRNRADFMPPYEFFSLILERDGGRKALFRKLGAEAGEPLDDFMDAAMEFERDHVPTLEGFLFWLETGAAEVKRDLEQGRNEVRVMTVHGAKGLQSEIVFIADAATVPAAQTDDRISWLNDGALPVWPAFKDNETADIAAAKEMRRDRAMAEYRRLLYVAMTRAKDRLYVTGFTGKRGPAETSWFEMVSRALVEMGERETDPDGRETLFYGETQTADPDGARVALEAVSNVENLPDWALAAPLPEPTPPSPLSPSRPDEDDPPVASPLTPDGGNRFKRGNAVHALMQTLPDLEPGNRDAAARRYLSHRALGFSTTEQDDIAAEVLGLFQLPGIEAVFGPGSKAEVPIVGMIDTADGPRTVAGQIDRLVHTGEEVIIIDYKTNRPPPDRAEDVAPVYLRQMATYRKLLEKVFPETPVRPVLLWTDGPKWMELQDNLLAPYAP